MAASLLAGNPSVAALASNSDAATNEFGLDVLRVSPRVAVVYGGAWPSAILALASSKGLVVVGSAEVQSIALGYRQAIATEFKRSDFIYLINSSEDDDHTGGNAAYADLPIIAHESARREMIEWLADPKTLAMRQDYQAAKEIAKVRDWYTKNYPPYLDTPAYAAVVKGIEAVGHDYHAGPVVPLPTVTFDRRLTLHLGDLTVQLVYFGGFSSMGDTIISVPEENLVMVGRLFFPQRIPHANAPKLAHTTTPAMVDNWLAVLREVLDESNGNTRVMACAERGFMNKGNVEQFLGYLDQMWAGVRRAKAEGKTLEQARAALPLKDFPTVARLSNQAFAGTEWEIRDIHQDNVDFFWKVLSH
jgi:hypothetical protein